MTRSFKIINLLFFGYSKYHSVTSMSIKLGLPSFDTLIINSRVSFFISVRLHRIVSLDIYVAYILFNVCVLSTVCLSLSLSLSLFVCVCVCFMYYGFKPETNAFIHTFIHSFCQDHHQRWH